MAVPTPDAALPDAAAPADDLVYLNGRYLPRREATVSVDDRGFVLADGVYEVTRVVGGRFFEEAWHLARLVRGARALDIAASATLADDVAAIGRRLVAEHGLADATVYVQLTRGAAPRTHHYPPPGTAPTLYVSVKRFPPLAAPESVGVAAITYPEIRWARCDIKTIALLPNAMAQQAAVARGAAHGIFVRDGAVTEGTHTNVFGVVDGELRTYPLCNYILGGITRDVVLELARAADIPARETPLYLTELDRLQELFVTGTTTDVTPVVTLDDRPVGDGRPGPITMRLRRMLLERMG